MTLAELNALIDANVPSGARPKIKATELRDVLHELADFSDGAQHLISDSLYGPLWDGDTTNAPSKNSIYDEMQKKVNLLTGSVLFDFPASDNFRLTTDNGGYIKAFLDLSTSGGAFIGYADSKLYANSNSIVLTQLNIGSAEISSATGLRLVDSRAGAAQVGWESGGDYSTYYTDRSFPDWGNVKTYADTKVKLSTGDVLFKFNSSNSFDITNDGNGGDYSKNYLYMSSVEVDLGFNGNYVGVSNSAIFFKQGAYTITAPTGVNGIVALASDVSLKISKSGDTMSGNLLFSGGSSIDTTATGGTDTLNIGTTNADVINIGNASTILNFLGTAIFEYQANQYVTDKLVTLNHGGAVASGIGVGYEIEENGVITGYFKTNGTRTGYSFKSPANAGVLNLITIGTDVDLTAGNSGTIAVVSDISWSNLTGKPTTIAGYGITDPIVLTSGSYANPSWITSLAWSKLTGVPSYEPALGNPGVDGYALISTAAGVRSWTPFPSTSPLTTKGDLYTFDTVNQRLAVGSNGKVLTADSSTDTGLVWSNVVNASGSITNLKSEDQIYLEGATNKTYPIISKKVYAETLTKVWGLKTTSGTCTVAIQINGTNVTGLSALSVTSTAQDVVASAANAMVAGDRMTIVITSAAAPVDLECTLEFTR
jgi:hypothetical protein